METTWKPNKWIASTLGFFLQPLGMLYVRRPAWALAYFVLSLAIPFLQLVLRQKWGTVWLQSFSFAVLLMPVCAVHAFLAAGKTDPSITRAWYTRWYGLATVSAMLVLIVFGVRAFLYEPFSLPTGSMAPTFAQGTVIVTQKWGYGNYGTFGISVFNPGPSNIIQRGDVLVFESPPNPSQSYVRRVIGLPGDRIQYRNKRLIINGSAVETQELSAGPEYDLLVEKLSGAKYRVFVAHDAPSRDFEFEVPEGNYFVLGDNRDRSSDSRYWGSVPAKNIVGRVVGSF